MEKVYQTLIGMMAMAIFLLAGSDLWGAEPKTYIQGKCIHKDFYLPCRMYKESIYINGKHHEYRLIAVTIVDSEHRFMIEDMK